MWLGVALLTCWAHGALATVDGAALRRAKAHAGGVRALVVACADGQMQCAAKCSNVVYKCANDAWAATTNVIDTYCPCDPGGPCTAAFVPTAEACKGVSSAPDSASSMAAYTATSSAKTTATAAATAGEATQSQLPDGNGGGGASGGSGDQMQTPSDASDNTTWVSETIPQCYELPGCEMGKMMGLKVGVNVYKTPFSLFLNQTYTPRGVTWHFNAKSDVVLVFPLPADIGYYEFCICFPKNTTHSVRFQLIACIGTNTLCSPGEARVYPFGGYIDVAWVEAQKYSFVQFGVPDKDQPDGDFIYPSGCCGFYPPIRNKATRPVVNGEDYLQIGCGSTLNCALSSRNTATTTTRGTLWAALLSPLLALLTALV